MSPVSPHVEHETQVAAQLASGAGHVLLQLRDQHPIAGQDPETDRWSATQARKRLRDAGDGAAHQWLVEQLNSHFPQDTVLSEEGKDNSERLYAQRVWIIDPLDGTREYAEGRDDWAVHVALWQRLDQSTVTSTSGAGQLVAAAIALPARGQVLTMAHPWGQPQHSQADQPAANHGQPDQHFEPQLDEQGRAHWTVAVSRTRPPAVLEEVKTHLAGSSTPVVLDYLPMGSAGVKIAAVILGQADAYLHAGGQYEWDSAAPVAVAHAAGLHATRVHGGPLLYNQHDPWLPDLLVCRPALADPLLQAIGTVVRSGPSLAMR